MAFALIAIGLVMLVSAVRNTTADLTKLIKGDFTGQGNFVYWLVSILVIGAIGYIPALRPVSRVFLALVIVVLFLKKGNPNGIGGGFFSQFNSQIGTTTTAAINNVNNSTIGLQTEAPSLTTLLQGV